MHSHSDGTENRAYSRTRTAVCVLLSGFLLVGSVLPSVAAEPRTVVVKDTYPLAPASPAEKRKRSSNDSILLGLGAVAVAVGACWLVGCFDGSADTSNRQGSQNYRNSNPSADRSDELVREDTSVGCAWGDRAYDTCQ